MVYFDTKQDRDAVKALAPNLANFKHEEAGMRLQIPDHLQKDFKALMNLSFDLKKKHPDVRRNVKFDEDCLGLYMDMQLEKEGSWRRTRPDHARQAARPRKNEGPTELDAAELRSLVGSDTDE